MDSQVRFFPGRNYFTSVLVPDLTDPLRAHEAAQMSTRMLTVALALHAYKGEHRDYPSTLDALSPKYVREIPVDLFVNRPLMYRKDGEGYLLYSVGWDMVDNGGVEMKRWGDPHDLVIRMER